MKPLTEYTEAELLGAGDEELGLLLAYELELITNKEVWNQCSLAYQVFLIESRGFASTGNGMLEVLEAMDKQGWDYVLSKDHGQQCQASFWQKKEVSAEHTSLPRAVAVAALLAVKGNLSPAR